MEVAGTVVLRVMAWNWDECLEGQGKCRWAGASGQLPWRAGCKSRFGCGCSMSGQVPRWAGHGWQSLGGSQKVAGLHARLHDSNTQTRLDLPSWIHDLYAFPFTFAWSPRAD